MIRIDSSSPVCFIFACVSFGKNDCAMTSYEFLEFVWYIRGSPVLLAALVLV